MVQQIASAEKFYRRVSFDYLSIAALTESLLLKKILSIHILEASKDCSNR